MLCSAKCRFGVEAVSSAPFHSSHRALRSLPESQRAVSSARRASAASIGVLSPLRAGGLAGWLKGSRLVWRGAIVPFEGAVLPQWLAFAELWPVD